MHAENSGLPSSEACPSPDWTSMEQKLYRNFAGERDDMLRALQGFRTFETPDDLIQDIFEQESFDSFFRRRETGKPLPGSLGN